MIRQVDSWNNFCRVFELPAKYPSKFCFGDGIPTNFQMVDSFYPVVDVPIATVTKEYWEKKVGPIESKDIDDDDLRIIVIPWLLGKKFVKPGRKYLVICEFGTCFIFSKEE